MTALKHLRDQLAKGNTVLIDGGTGTEIEAQGGAMVEGAWCGAASLTHSAIVQSVHEQYLQLGAKVIIANNYATSRHVLAQAGWEDQFEELNRAGIELAVAARTAVGADDAVVAGSLSTTTQGGEQPPVEELLTNLTEGAQIQADAGAELLILEMMGSIGLTEIALTAAGRAGLPVWLGWSCEERNGVPWLHYGGETLDDAMRWAREAPVELMAIMHTQTSESGACLEVIKRHWDGPIGVYAHTGIWEPPHWIFENTISPEAYAAAARGWITNGAQVVGGCCGIGPAHIAELAKTLTTL
ncbi:MAG: homocysteine S-methyltransferase family protein [Acidimicrobiales bacterium]|nr:homocysteine S-methyltransferase family protein [Acidimicrobiales bacterium]